MRSILAPVMNSCFPCRATGSGAVPEPGRSLPSIGRTSPLGSDLRPACRSCVRFGRDFRRVAVAKIRTSIELRTWTPATVRLCRSSRKRSRRVHHRGVSSRRRWRVRFRRRSSDPTSLPGVRSEPQPPAENKTAQSNRLPTGEFRAVILSIGFLP